MKKILIALLLCNVVLAQDTIIVTDDEIVVCDYNDNGVLICI